MPTFLIFFINVPVYFFQLGACARAKEKNILSNHFAIFILFFIIILSYSIRFQYLY